MADDENYVVYVLLSSIKYYRSQYTHRPYVGLPTCVPSASSIVLVLCLSVYLFTVVRREACCTRWKAGMSGLESMETLSEAMEAESRQRLQSSELWRRLEQYRASTLSAATSTDIQEAQRTELATGLLKDVELRLLFVAVDYAYQNGGDETKRRAIDSTLVSIFGSSVGPKLYEVCPVFQSAIAYQECSYQYIVDVGEEC